MITEQIAEVLGINSSDRLNAVKKLYRATELNPMVYWYQLFVAAGIAALGLILNSTAVVIGAMLVSPLMTPIVQLGMAFAIGHLYFAIKSAFNLIVSYALVVAIAAVITKWLPFEQVTSEILARTQPTALDLIVALFCGLAASFSVAKQSKDVVSAAAGTAIAIALVPPICVVGFGIGIKSVQIALGANLLFTANLAAIILVTNLFFFLTGFSRIDAALVEEAVLDEDDFNSWLYRTTKRVRVSKNRSRSATLRVFLPLVFVIVLFFPLSEALKRVSWEVNTKKAINGILDTFEESHRVLSRFQVVSHGVVQVRLTLLGKPADKEKISQNLSLKLAAACGTEPTLVLEIIPSSDFMDDRLKKSNEWFTEQLANLKMEEESAKILSPEEAAKSLGAIFFRKRLYDEFEKTVDFVRSSDKEAEWIDWSVDIGKDGTGLSVVRIADSPLSVEAIALIEGMIHKETGLRIQVKQTTIEHTLYEAEKSGTVPKNGSELEKNIQSLLGRYPICFYIELKDPEKAKSPTEKKQVESMNKALLGFIEKAAPSATVKQATGETKWAIYLAPIPPAPAPTPEPPAEPKAAGDPDKPTSAPQAQSSETTPEPKNNAQSADSTSAPTPLQPKEPV